MYTDQFNRHTNNESEAQKQDKMKMLGFPAKNDSKKRDEEIQRR
jgi:hypothetical protein